MSDKDAIKELMEHGYSKKGAKKTLAGIKRGLNDIKYGRISKYKPSSNKE